MKCFCNLYVSQWSYYASTLQIVDYMRMWRKKGGTKGHHDTSTAAAAVGEKAQFRTKRQWLVKKSSWSVALAIFELCLSDSIST